MNVWNKREKKEEAGDHSIPLLKLKKIKIVRQFDGNALLFCYLRDLHQKNESSF